MRGQPRGALRQGPAGLGGGAKDAVLGVTVNGHAYGLFGPGGSTWSGLDGATFVNEAGGRPYFSVALLPDERPATLERFRRYAYSHVTGHARGVPGGGRRGEGRLPLHRQAVGGRGDRHALRALPAPVEVRERPADRDDLRLGGAAS